MGADHNDASHGDHPGMLGDSALSDRAKRALAIRELLLEKGIIDADDVRRRADELHRRSPADGAKVVARAWIDADFKARLLDDAKAAVAELGYVLPHDAELAVVENTDELHNLVVCTLCSCYPTTLLGPPPDWYKSLAYRSRAVREPRAVMAEFGFTPADGVEVRVLDSTADLRYLVLPARPAGTEGMSEEELAALVTRDSMVGVTAAESPQAAAV